MLVAALAVAEETRNITIIWYLAACDGSAPAIICPVIIPGIHCGYYAGGVFFFFWGGGRGGGAGGRKKKEVPWRSEKKVEKE